MTKGIKLGIKEIVLLVLVIIVYFTKDIFVFEYRYSQCVTTKLDVYDYYENHDVSQRAWIHNQSKQECLELVNKGD